MADAQPAPRPPRPSGSSTRMIVTPPGAGQIAIGFVAATYIGGGKASA
mgnify:CR=1 FL=1